MPKYKGISFAEGYNKSFAIFKKEFAQTIFFKKIPEPRKEQELKEAYKVATGKDADVETAKKELENGDTKSTASKSKKSGSSEDK